MITSAVFGSLQVLPRKDYGQALSLLIGSECAEATDLFVHKDLTIDLWPSFRKVGDRKRVEPDVIVEYGGWSVVVEVKWHAPLSDHQLEYQLAAAQQYSKDVAAIILLGEPGVASEIGGIPCFRRTWRQVSADLHQATQNSPSDEPIHIWTRLVMDFLQATDLGRAFDGLPSPIKVQPEVYRFRYPGRSPWHARRLASVPKVHFSYSRDEI